MGRAMQFALCLLLCVGAGCASAGEQPATPDGPIGGTDAPRFDAPSLPDAQMFDAAPEVLEITHNAAETVLTNTGRACGVADISTSQNSFYRVFALGDFGVTGAYTITDVRFGVDLAEAPDNSNPMVLRFHTLTGVLNTSNLTPIGAETVILVNTAQQIVPVALTTPVTVPAGATLVVELDVPDGSDLEKRFYPGANLAGESGPSYLRASECNINQPTASGAATGGEFHWVLVLTGTI